MKLEMHVLQTELLPLLFAVVSPPPYFKNELLSKCLERAAGKAEGMQKAHVSASLLSLTPPSPEHWTINYAQRYEAVVVVEIYVKLVLNFARTISALQSHRAIYS